ncbi:MAG: hypothetical protein RID91_16750 [Azospirillaceae bacterium]
MTAAMTVEFVSSSRLFDDFHALIDRPARESLREFVDRCERSGQGHTVSELMFLYAWAIASAVSVLMADRGGETEEFVKYINDEMQYSFLEFLAGDGEEPGISAEDAVAGRLDDEIRFYYEVIAIALESASRRLPRLEDGRLWQTVSDAVDQSYARFKKAVARHTRPTDTARDKGALVNTVCVAQCTRILGRAQEYRDARMAS